MDDPRPIRIVQSRPAWADHEVLVFLAQDAGGRLQLFVTATHWESLMAEAPPMADGEDRHDYALSRLEAQAVGREVGVSSVQGRVVLVG